MVHLVALPLVAWGLERLINTASPKLATAGTSSSLLECVGQLQKQDADVIVVDLDNEANPDALAQFSSQVPGRILAITSTTDSAQHDRAILAGARGVVSKRESPAALLKAIEKVKEGEIWLDRDATSRIFMQLVKGKASHAADPAQGRIASLTRRERQTVAAVASDASAPGKVIADRLNMSEHTLRNHLTSIYGKLGVTNRVDLYAFAHKHGLAEPARLSV